MLSRHTTIYHVAEKSDFASTFPCPECRRLEWADSFIHNPSEWSSQVANCHGREHATSLPPSWIRCLLCDKSVVSVKYHVLRHLKAGLFSEPFACPECARLGQKAEDGCATSVPWIHDYDAWRHHSAAVHSEMAPAMGPKERTRCLVCNQSFNDMTGHFGRKHVREGLFSQPFRCPECARQGMAESDDGPLISTREEWNIHCETIHNDTSPSTTGVSLGLKRKRQRGRDNASDSEGGSRKHSILWREGSVPPINPAQVPYFSLAPGYLD
ncbi:hypothetical protein LA080_013297 [Diaporthe eres]|nr:hypothetical protein LA080_013297 [Diaporthe eres]